MDCDVNNLHVELFDYYNESDLRIISGNGSLNETFLMNRTGRHKFKAEVTDINDSTFIDEGIYSYEILEYTKDEEMLKKDKTANEYNTVYIFIFSLLLFIIFVYLPHIVHLPHCKHKFHNITLICLLYVIAIVISLSVIIYISIFCAEISFKNIYIYELPFYASSFILAVILINKSRNDRDIKYHEYEDLKLSRYDDENVFWYSLGAYFISLTISFHVFFPRILVYFPNIPSKYLIALSIVFISFVIEVILNKLSKNVHERVLLILILFLISGLELLEKWPNIFIKIGPSFNPKQIFYMFLLESIMLTILLCITSISRTSIPHTQEIAKEISSWINSFK